MNQGKMSPWQLKGNLVFIIDCYKSSQPYDISTSYSYIKYSCAPKLLWGT